MTDEAEPKSVYIPQHPLILCEVTFGSIIVCTKKMRSFFLGYVMCSSQQVSIFCPTTKQSFSKTLFSFIFFNYL